MVRMRRGLLFLILASSLAVGQAKQSPQAQPPSKTTSQKGVESAEADQQYALAVTLFNDKKVDEAITAAKRAAELREKTDGRDSPQTAKALWLLASYYNFKGRKEQAEPLYQRAISIWEKNPSTEPSDHVTALEEYACLLQKNEREDEAEKFGRRANALIWRLNVEADSSANPSDSKLRQAVPNQAVANKSQASHPDVVHLSGEFGKVVVKVVVDESGKVILACAQSGPNTLREPSVRAAYRARFTPTLLEGVPVKVVGSIIYNFLPK
jgi:tetratricopeptide (TPR) repeat protein